MSPAPAEVAIKAVQRVLQSPIAAPTWIHETTSWVELRLALSDAGIALGIG
ncbi:hypothetical protein C8K38_12394 [Rhodococcus sp. OK611]|nr:hypothetical protein C8K38_12394 [Rhodococcus sp. OK611]SNX93795.1 hypothetical protein SAMN05447004_12394 [Rhodococcus sp. OK270]